MPLTIEKISRRVLMSIPYLTAIVLAGVGAFLLRFDFRIPAEQAAHLAFALSTWTVVKCIVFYLGGLHRAQWRHVSLPDVLAIVAYNALGSGLAMLGIATFGPAGFPRSIYLLDLLLCIQALCAAHFLARLRSESRGRRQGKGCEGVLIYGAGHAGAMLLRELRGNASLRYRVCGFVDDDRAKKGTLLHRIAVLGAGADLVSIARENKIREILIAIPSATREQMTAILGHCREARVACKTVPGVAELSGHRSLVPQLRDVAVEDLLGRSPIQLDDAGIRQRLSGEKILVTGAAGSIGAELCRQLARFSPAAIVGLDIAETGLFYIEREMKKTFPGVSFIPEVGSIQNSYRVEEVLARHQPSMVFHAAAYKHVPMMETNMVEAVENNIFGTSTVARAAARAGVRDFVMISSDKAVNPTNVMGATKRAAELLIRDLPQEKTKYVSVRFGNVLGSNGSVVPIFQQQIAAGGPVTITHPEMRRYFMTIPEAAQLVIQASTMGKGGEIFVLDMGEPVKILELAQKLILLSGLRPGRDIPIVYTGIRPGEKLFEELNLEDELTLATCHRKIKVFQGTRAPAGFGDEIRRLELLCETRDEARLLQVLRRIVPGYCPQRQVTEPPVEVALPRLSPVVA